MFAGTRIVPVSSTEVSGGTRHVRSSSIGIGVGVGSGVEVASFAIDPTDLQPAATNRTRTAKCTDRMLQFYTRVASAGPHLLRQDP